MKTLVMIGAALGSATFLAIGLLPAMSYGGYAGILLASGIGFGGPALAVFGMTFAVAGVGSLFTVLGSMVGAGIYGLARLATSTPRPELQK